MWSILPFRRTGIGRLPTGSAFSIPPPRFPRRRADRGPVFRSFCQYGSKLALKRGAGPASRADLESYRTARHAVRRIEPLLPPAPAVLLVEAEATAAKLGNMIDIVCVFCGRDLELLRLQARSIGSYFERQGLGRVIYVWNDTAALPGPGVGGASNGSRAEESREDASKENAHEFVSCGIVARTDASPMRAGPRKHVRTTAKRLLRASADVLTLADIFKQSSRIRSD